MWGKLPTYEMYEHMGNTYTYKGNTYTAALAHVHAIDAYECKLRQNLCVACISAAEVGCVEVLSTVMSHCGDIPGLREVWDTAARNGHWRMLQYMVRAVRTNWKKVYKCTDLVEHGHLEMLQWARGAGFDWGRNVCVMAKHADHDDYMLVWMHSGPRTEWPCIVEGDGPCGWAQVYCNCD